MLWLVVLAPNCKTIGKNDENTSASEVQRDFLCAVRWGGKRREKNSLYIYMNINTVLIYFRIALLCVIINQKKSHFPNFMQHIPGVLFAHYIFRGGADQKLAPFISPHLARIMPPKCARTRVLQLCFRITLY